MRPNVLLVVFDTARADALEPYGAPSGSSPAVADLARRGVVVPGVHATANWTLPSHASMLTGLLPRALGLNSAAPTAAFRSHAGRMLPQVLRRAGYATAAVSANLWVARRYGFASGFDRFVEVTGKRRHRPREGAWRRVRWSLDAVRARTDDGIGRARATVGNWIRDAPQGPFFWFVNLMECHSPYLPPRPYNDLGLRERFRAGRDAARFQSHEGVIRACIGELDVPADSLARMRHLYRQAVRSMDDWLAGVLEDLDRVGILDDTIVIVTSDHGENFGEARLFGHALSLDDRLLRVPLVAAGPDRFPTPQGVSSQAVLPALLAEAVGLDDHPWEEAPCPPGVAIAQSEGFSGFTGQTVDGFVRAWNLPRGQIGRMLLRRTCATDGRFKLVREDDQERLFDLAADPHETVDVLPAHAPAAAPLRAAMDMAEKPVPVEDGVVSSNDGPDPEAALDDEAAALEERMKLLGYL